MDEKHSENALRGTRVVFQPPLNSPSAIVYPPTSIRQLDETISSPASNFKTVDRSLLLALFSVGKAQASRDLETKECTLPSYEVLNKLQEVRPIVYGS